MNILLRRCVATLSGMRLGCIALVCFPLLCAFPLQAQDTQPKPKQVFMSFAINSVGNISAVKQTFTADFYLRMRWYDSNYQAHPLGEITGTPDWYPQLDFTNSTKVATKVLNNAYTLIAPGVIETVNRYSGDFQSKMDLNNFPFDQQTFAIKIEDFRYLEHEAVFILEQQENGPFSELTIASQVDNIDNVWEVEGFTIPEWNIETVSVNYSSHKYEFYQGAEFSQFQIDIALSRKPEYYLLRVVLVVYFLIVISWVVFLLPTTDLNNRTRIVLSLFLALVANDYVFSSILPRISYLTQLDFFILGHKILLFLVAMHSVVVHRMAQTEQKIRMSLAKALDRLALLIFPFISLSIAFWTLYYPNYM